MEKMWALITTSLNGGGKPTDAEVADAVMDALDVIASIANSLERIAAVQEQRAASI